jgi:hypothetical protein
MSKFFIKKEVLPVKFLTAALLPRIFAAQNFFFDKEYKQKQKHLKFMFPSVVSRQNA